MLYREISGSKALNASVLALGTWSFGSDKWWGNQPKEHSIAVLGKSIESGITLSDTAPVYGRGESESVIGEFLTKKKCRNKLIIATKVGLNWQKNGPGIFHDLSPKRMIEEIDASRKRLNIDFIDLYQIHWPDPETPIQKSAETMYSFLSKGLINSVGVSNFSLEQIKKFLKHCPLNCLQPQYSLFERSIENEIIPFCEKNKIAIITYAPLYSGLLTGKFFIEKKEIPNDINRKTKKRDLTEPFFSINRKALLKIKTIADKYQKTLTQTVLNWNFSQKGITSTIAGIRNLVQLKENLGSIGWSIQNEDLKEINLILEERAVEISKQENDQC